MTCYNCQTETDLMGSTDGEVWMCMACLIQELGVEGCE